MAGAGVLYSDERGVVFQAKVYPNTKRSPFLSLPPPEDLSFLSM